VPARRPKRKPPPRRPSATRRCEKRFAGNAIRHQRTPGQSAPLAAGGDARYRLSGSSGRPTRSFRPPRSARPVTAWSGMGRKAGTASRSSRAAASRRRSAGAGQGWLLRVGTRPSPSARRRSPVRRFRYRKDLQEIAQDPRHEELWSLTPSGRRIVIDVLMRRRRQTGRPRSARLIQCRSEKGPAPCFR